MRDTGRPSLPSIGRDIPRPSSTSSQGSHYTHTPLRHSSAPSLQLPALSALANLASSSSLSYVSDNSPFNVRRSMNYATAAPATPSGQGNSPPVCQNCGTGTTPLWRRDEAGSVLCNACGLFLKLHGRPRPISLKTDVIKSRNRVKTTAQGLKKKDINGVNSLAAAHPDLGGPVPNGLLRGPSQKISSGLSDRSNSPVSRTVTPGLHHTSNIAPQHMFDGVTFDGSGFHSPSLANLAHLRHPSPSASSVGGLEAPLTYDALINHNNSLKTRVSELEVINDLFRGRVGELENSEQDARRCLEQANSREAEMKRRIEDLENELSEYRSPGMRHKRVKMSDIIDESQTSNPLSTSTLT